MKKAILDRVFSAMRGGGFEVRYWDGTERRYGNGDVKVKLVINDPLVVDRLVSKPVLAFGEAYMDGKIEVEGDLREIVRLAIVNQELLTDKSKGNIILKALKVFRKHRSATRQKDDVQFHYDIGNDFFKLWLDETMSYSCAYFRTPDDTLFQAQLNKIDHILRKLQIDPGQTLLDVGSGWGWLIIRAAEQYGIKALGITLSEEQTFWSRKRIVERGLEGRVEVELMDYRTLAGKGRKFDRVVSVGMFEHVGKENLPLYMEAVQKILVPGGLSMLHTITHVREDPVNPWIDKHIFPGGYIPSLRETIWLLPDYGFHLLDVESLRLHYAQTLEHWARNFEAVLDRVRAMYTERFVRMWRLYLNLCAASFRYSGLDVHQILFSRGLNNNLALTRDHVYDYRQDEDRSVRHKLVSH
ncbi:MAG: cyclopropane-fatty-acyl-phospholipid synthase family protein [Bacillota bacterium]